MFYTIIDCVLHCLHTTRIYLFIREIICIVIKKWNWNSNELKLMYDPESCWISYMVLSRRITAWCGKKCVASFVIVGQSTISTIPWHNSLIIQSYSLKRSLSCFIRFRVVEVTARNCLVTDNVELVYCLLTSIFCKSWTRIRAQQAVAILNELLSAITLLLPWHETFAQITGSLLKCDFK